MLEQSNIELEIADAIIERPFAFNADGIRFCILPPTLGKTMVLDVLTKELGFDMESVRISPYLEALRVCAERTEDVARIVAVHTTATKEELFDEDELEKRTKMIKAAASVEELASLLVVLMTRYGTGPFVEHLGLDRDAQDRERVRRCKKAGKGSYTFGGKSVYGTVIDYACERYGWTMDYVVWGISYQNLQMLMADAVQSIYLTEEEQKGCHVASSSDGIKINGDDPEMAATLAKLLD